MVIEEYTVQFPTEKQFIATSFDGIEFRKTYREDDFSEADSGVGTLIVYLRIEQLW